MDWGHPRAEGLYRTVVDGRLVGDTEFLRAAHTLISERVQAVYALDETQPVSTTLRRGRGSCSQRLAVLEALARRHTIATRVRGLLVHGKFWYPRFPHLHAVVPDRVLLAWPHFLIDDHWCDVSDLLGRSSCPTAAARPAPFSNAGSETLFDAIGRAPIRWDNPEAEGCVDLSRHLAADLGFFDDRDQVFARYGQNLCWPLRTVLDPVLRRWCAA